MKRRSKAGGKASKALGREALKTKRRDASKTAIDSARAFLYAASVMLLVRGIARAS
jgi:hypothetical protein